MGADARPERDFEGCHGGIGVHRARRVGGPTHHTEAGVGVHESAIDADVERAVTRVEVALTIGDDEEAVALDGEVSELAGGLQRTLAHD